jgi:hypothetical protein
VGEREGEWDEMDEGSLPALGGTVEHLLQTDEALDERKLGGHIHLPALQNLPDCVAGGVESPAFLADGLVGEELVESLQGALRFLEVLNLINILPTNLPSTDK